MFYIEVIYIEDFFLMGGGNLNLILMDHLRIELEAHRNCTFILNGRNEFLVVVIQMCFEPNII